MSLQRLHPGARQAFAHRHGADEEVSFAGSGTATVDGEAVALAPLDGLELLAFGTHTEGDGEVLSA